MGGEQDVALEVDQTVVDRGDGLQIQMVGRLIHHQHVRAVQHHAREHTAYLLTAGQDVDRLVDIVARKQHLAEERAQGGLQRIGLGIRREPVQHGLLMTVEKFGIVLREVRLTGRDAPLERTLVRLQLAHQDLEQRGRRLLGLADKRDFIAARDAERDVVQDFLPVDGLADAGHLEDVLARLAVHLESDERITAGGCRKLLDTQLVNQLAAAGRLTGFGLVGGEAADEFLQLLDLLIGTLFLVVHHALHELGGLIPKIVVADIHPNLAVVDVHNMRADIVEEVTVMRDDDDRALVIREEVLQPLNRADVQMVGRLVEQQNLRIAEQCLCQHNLDLFRVRTVAHMTEQNLIGIQTQTLQQLCRVGVGVPAVQLGELALQLGGAVAVLLGERVLGVQRILLLHDLIQARIALNDGIEYRELVERKVILTQNRHTQTGLHLDRAGGRLEIAGEHTQEGGLAGAVRADDTVAVAGCEFEIDIREQVLTVKVNAEMVDRKHKKAS